MNFARDVSILYIFLPVPVERSTLHTTEHIAREDDAWSCHRITAEKHLRQLPPPDTLTFELEMDLSAD